MGKGNPTSEQKLKAIETLVKHGARGSEWKEAGLLRAIEQILDGADLSSANLQKLMEEVKKW